MARMTHSLYNATIEQHYPSWNQMNEWLARRHSKEQYRGGFIVTTPEGNYQRDRARVIHSSALRSLQSKTQVLGVGESDFYRTRLTHSLEVAQISSGICETLRDKYQDDVEIQHWLPSMSLIEAIALSHDLGHPPFGHGGEIALNHMMHRHGGFEGNGQTLRIIARLGEYSPEQGFNLTRRTLLGVLKYPALYSDVANYPDNIEQHASSNISCWEPPKCIMDDEAEILEWIVEPFSIQDRQQFRAIKKQSNRHHRATCKAFDTSIMEIADDIAYGVHDLEDALTMRLVDFHHWKKEVIEPIMALGDNDISREIEFYNQKLFADKKTRKHAISKLVGFLVRHIEIQHRTQFDPPLLTYQAILISPANKILDLLKAFIFKHVIKSPEVQALEFKGQQMILRLFEVLSENPLRLLPEEHQQLYRQSHNPQRVICDYIASLTDSQATKLYHKLFTPSSGSIFERL